MGWLQFPSRLARAASVKPLKTFRNMWSFPWETANQWTHRTCPCYPCCGAFSSQSDDTSIKLSESLVTTADCKCLLVLVVLNRIPCTPSWHTVYPSPKKVAAPKQSILKLTLKFKQRPTFIYFLGTGIWTHGLSLVMQVFYPSSPLCFSLLFR
jgi:hypothetical protein